MVAGSGLLAKTALRFVRHTAIKASKVIRAKIANAARPVNAALEPVFAKSTHPRQPIHPSALLCQQKSRRWYSTSTYQNINVAVRRFMSTGSINATPPRVDRSKFLNSKTGRAIAQFTGKAPFASTLRPNLTGGALPRTAGGYNLGSGRIGGARYFSHTPAAQAQVVQNVSAAVRAFYISGQKAQFDGFDARGEKRYRSVSTLQDETTRKMAALPRSTSGSYIDFRLNPVVTALSPLAAGFPFTANGVQVPAIDFTTLNTEGFIDVLSMDFAHAFKDLTATLSDIKKLSSLGDLPIQLEKGSTLRVRFPGVGAETVESLCEDLGLARGIIREDPEFYADPGVVMALKFPFAPDTNGPTIPTLTSPGGSLRSLGSFAAEEELFEGFSEVEENPWPSTEPEGYESASPLVSSGVHLSSDFEGIEAIHRFLEECDRARGRF